MLNELYTICREAYCSDEKAREARWDYAKQWLEKNMRSPKLLEDSTHYKDEYAATPLHYLLRANPPSDLVHKMIQFAPDTLREQSISGWLPLHVALYNKASFVVVKILLLAHPKSAEVQNIQGHLPLHIACSVGASLELLDLLLLAYPEGIDIKDTFNYLPSTYLKSLVDSIQSNECSFLLHNAITGGFSKHLLKLLLRAFPESCIKQDNKGMIPLHHACASTAPQFASYVMVLLEANSTDSLVVQDYEGRTPLQLQDENKKLPLHRLVSSSIGMTEKYLQLLANAYPESIETADKNSLLPFHYACLNPTSTVEVLMFFLQMSPEVLHYFVSNPTEAGVWL
jgi:ankyrin repeat protein